VRDPRFGVGRRASLRTPRRPGVGRGEHRDRQERAVHRRGGHAAPARAVEVEDHRAPHGEAIPHGPDVVAGIGRDASEDVAGAGEGGAGDEGPARAVPVLDHVPRQVITDSHGPGVGRRDGRDRSQRPALREPRTGDDVPTRAVPVLNQRLRARRPDGPDIVAGHGGYAREGAAVREGGGGDDAPVRAVEVHGECLLGAAGVRLAHGPDIVVSDRSGRAEGRIGELRDDVKVLRSGVSVRHDTSNEHYQQHKRANRSEPCAD